MNSYGSEVWTFAAGRAAVQDLVSSSAAIRLTLITTARLARWSDVAAGMHAQVHTSIRPLPLQQWVIAWGSSSNSSSKIIHGHEHSRGGLFCSSVEDVAHMAKSLRQRVLVKLNYMAS